jgi:DNA repair protein RadC
MGGEREWKQRVSGHRQRLREKLLARGIGALSDVEVVEMLLALGTPRRDCKDAAREALARFGSLAGVLEARPEELTRVRGIGPANSAAILLVHQVGRRFLETRLRDRQYLRSSREVAEYLGHWSRGQDREVFKVILLDTGLRIIGSRDLFTGTVDRGAVYPREVARVALAANAAAVVVAHNHPSGNSRPSDEDRSLTRRLYLACAACGIRLLDHLVAGEEVYSFADHGLMEEIARDCAGVFG